MISAKGRQTLPKWLPLRFDKVSIEGGGAFVTSAWSDRLITGGSGPLKINMRGGCWLAFDDFMRAFFGVMRSTQLLPH